MALKHVKKYYRDIEKLYFSLAANSAEFENDFKEGIITEDELNNILAPINAVKNNYMMLSYVMFLFMKPSKEKKNNKFNKQYAIFQDYFKYHKVDEDSKIDEANNCLDIFKKFMLEEKAKKGDVNE